jgi:nitroimidazol reductase NimA-like FMN-containing flavoprotein (pyridoxamine 5'-phosphate oxidase superfamily)
MSMGGDEFTGQNAGSAVIGTTDRTRIRRLPELTVSDRATAYGILDAGLVAHVGLNTPEGPLVIPNVYARIGDVLYLHGSVASRAMRSFGRSEPVSVAVTIVDGHVLARSAFNMSMNYRCVIAFGVPVTVTDPDERLAAWKAILERAVPGHWDTVRPPNSSELKQTAVFALTLDEISAKVRTGPPDDEAPDYDLPIWAGVLPIRTVVGAPEPDPAMPSSIPLPATLRGAPPS